MRTNIEQFAGTYPSGQKEYLMNYGEHFSKNAAKFAIKNLKRSNGKVSEEKLKMKTPEEVDSFLASYGISIKNDVGYDKVYLYSKCMADYFGSSVPDEMHVAKYIKDVLDDEDGYDGMPFVEWYHKILHLGIPVMWEDIM